MAVRGGDLGAVGIVVDPVQRVQEAPDTRAEKGQRGTAERPQSSAALLGWSRRPFQTMTKAKAIMPKNGTISSEEKIEPIHCQ